MRVLVVGVQSHALHRNCAVGVEQTVGVDLQGVSCAIAARAQLDCVDALAIGSPIARRVGILTSSKTVRGLGVRPHRSAIVGVCASPHRSAIGGERATPHRSAKGGACAIPDRSARVGDRARPRLEPAVLRYAMLRGRVRGGSVEGLAICTGTVQLERRHGCYSVFGVD